MLNAHRSSDAVITICQDDQKRAVEVRELNGQAETALGYKTEQVSGKTLAELLPERIRTLLNEYVEYDANGNDVGDVLGKVQSFCILDSKGQEHGFRLKVLRTESEGKRANFRLILQDRAGNKRNEAFRSVLRENFKGHEVLHAATGLPDKNSITKDLELVAYYVNKEALKATFAAVYVDKPEAIGKKLLPAVLKHIAALAKQNLRNDDTIGHLNDEQLAMILLDAQGDSARMVLNRLRWLIAANPYMPDGKTALPLTVSIGFKSIIADTDIKSLIPDTERFMTRMAQGEGNALMEIG